MTGATRRKFVTDTLLYTASQVLLRLRGLITLPLLARLVGAEGYGIFTQTSATIALLVPFISFRLDTASVRFLSAEENKLRFRQYFYVALLFILLVSLIAAVLLVGHTSLAAQVIFGDIIYSGYMLPAAFSLVTSTTFKYLSNYFRISSQITVMSGVLLAHSALGVGCIITAVYMGYGIWGALWSLGGVDALFGLVLLLIIGRQVGWLGFTWQGLKEMLGYSIPLMPNSIMLWTVNYGDRLVITQLLGVAAVGAYSASYSLSQVLNLLIMPLGFVLFPLVSKLWDQGETDEVRRYFIYTTRYYLFISLPACVGLALISQSVLKTLATTEFVTSRLLVFWVAFGIVLNGLFQINVYVFHLTLKTKYVTFILLVSSVLNIGLNFLLVPVIGLEGSAFATAVTFLLMAIAAVVYGRRLIGYRLKWLDIGKSVLASLVMALGVYWIPMNSLAEIVGVVALGGFIYLGSLIALRTFTTSEILKARQLVLSLLPHRILR
jgi:O-antigen/teichoic acid export membrane protein